jgi:signal transduction histidine kinase
MIVALRKAAQAFSAYGKHADQAQATEIQQLRQHITELAQNVENSQADAAEQISRLREEVTQLAR